MEEYIVPGKARPLGRYPHVKRVGNFIFVSGTSSRRPDGSVAGAEEDDAGTLRLDIVVQTRAVIGNIADFLKAVGAGLDDIVDVTTFLVNMEDFDGYNETYGEYFDDSGPTRTTVAVRSLPNPLLLIEMKVLAHIGGAP